MHAAAQPGYEPSTMKRFPFEITLQPRLSETDMLGHINNTVAGVWYEAGRTNVMDLMYKTVPEFDQLMRSEERRVGKESRSRWVQELVKDRIQFLQRWVQRW